MPPPLRSPPDLAKAETIFLSCSNHLHYVAVNPPVVSVVTRVLTSVLQVCGQVLTQRWALL